MGVPESLVSDQEVFTNVLLTASLPDPACDRTLLKSF